MGYGIDATVRGPERWKRAQRNAWAEPESFGAKLYAARVNAADLIAASGGVRDIPRCFLKTEYSTPRWMPEVESERKRQYYTCGTVCTAMQAALDFGKLVLMNPDDQTSIDWTELARYVTGELDSEWRRIEPLRPIRKVRCQVCAKQILPSGAVQEELPQEPEVQEETPAAPEVEGTTWLVGPRGEMLKPEEVRVLRLTEREQFLMGMATAEMRIAFADQYGEPLA